MGGGGVEIMVSGESGSGLVGRSWEWLNPEVLALIFVRLPAEERAGTMAMVCRSWMEAVAGPYCWTEIDIEQWCRKCKRPDLVDVAVRKLVRRSKCTFRRLSAYMVGNSGFSFAANCGKCLKVLQIPMSDVTDVMVERHAESLVNVTILDISNCLKITSKGIEALGKNCRALVSLKRNMPPPKWERPARNGAQKTDDSEATTIAGTMTRLQSLEIAYGRLGDRGLETILNKCTGLTHLDITGCWNVELKGDLEGKCEEIPMFKSPWFDNFDFYVDGMTSDIDGSDDESMASSDSDRF